MDLHSDFDRFVEIEKQPDNQAPVQPHLPTDDSDLPVTNLPGQDQNQLIQPDDTSPDKLDVFNNPLDPVDQNLVRQTRSGKVYTAQFVSSILKPGPISYKYASDMEVPLLYASDMDVPQLHQLESNRAFQEACTLHDSLLSNYYEGALQDSLTRT